MTKLRLVTEGNFNDPASAVRAILDAVYATSASVAARASMLTRTTVKTANYTAALWDLVPCNTSGGAFTVTIPAASGGKGRVAIKLVTAGNTLNLALTGSDHFNTTTGPTTGTLTLTNQGVVLESDGAGVWTITADDLALSQLDARFDAAGAAAAAQAAAIAASAQRASNLSDLASAATARANLGLGTAAVQPTSAFLAAGNVLGAARTTDHAAVNNSTALVTDDVLTLAVAANSVYIFEAVLFFDATATADMTFGWARPTGSSGYWVPNNVAAASSGVGVALQHGRSIITGTATAGGIGTTGSTTTDTVQPRGTLITGSTAGSFALQYAQANAEVSDMILRTGSYLRLTKVA